MNSNCFIVITQWDQKVLKKNLCALRETLVPQNCVMFLNIDPGSNSAKISQSINVEPKKMKKYDQVFFKGCDANTTSIASTFLKKKFPAQTLFTFSEHVINNVTNITDFNEVGIIQKEPETAMAQ